MIVEDPRPYREEASPLLLVHGFLGEPADWDAVIADLSVHRRVLRANLLLHDAAEPDLQALAEALALAIERASVVPVSVVGYSLGGRVTMTLAASRPELMRRAIAISSTPGLEDGVERAARAGADEALAVALEQQGLSAFIERWYAQPLFASLRDHPDFGLVARRREAGDAAAWANILRIASPGSNPSLWDRLEGMSAGLSMAVGALDGKYLAVAHDVARRAPHVRVDVIDGAGHAAHLERPEAVAALIDSLLP